MSSNLLKKTLQKDKLYAIADHIWTVAAWIWSAVIIVFLVSFAAGLAVAEPSDQTISGKTTFLRSVAYHLADTLLSSTPPVLANGSSPIRIPILIKTNDYADWLAKEPGTLRQFLIMQWRIHKHT